MNFELVLTWLKRQADTTTLAESECDQLEAALQLARKAAVAAQTKKAEARTKAEALARASGYESLQSMLDALGLATGGAPSPKPTRATAGGGAKAVRKPFMIPTDPDRLFAIAAHHNTPPEVAVLLEQGWSKDELHYKRLATACRLRGIELGWDPIERYKQLSAQARG